MKFTYTSRKILLATSRDQKQKTKRFLLSPVALSICTLRIGGKDVAGSGCANGGGRDDSQISAPRKRALYNGLDHELANKCLLEDFGGNSKSRSSLAMDPTM